MEHQLAHIQKFVAYEAAACCQEHGTSSGFTFWPLPFSSSSCVNYQWSQVNEGYFLALSLVVPSGFATLLPLSQKPYQCRYIAVINKSQRHHFSPKESIKCSEIE